MRKFPIASFSLGVFLVFFCLGHPVRGYAASLMGVWKGTAQRITAAGCSSVPVTVQVAHQCGHLVNGTTIVEGKTLTFVGRIRNDLSVNLHGQTQTGTNEYTIFSLTGSYSASPTPRITVTEFSYYKTFPENTEYEIFQTAYSGPITNKGTVPFMLLLGE